MTKIVQKGEGSGVLRETATPVKGDEFDSEALREIIAKMKEALHETQDGVAIAAPQIGISKRIFLVRDTVFAERGDLDTADQEFINPDIVNTSQDTDEFDEGCLSVRNTYGKVTRHTQATVRAQNVFGDEFAVGGSGLLAQIFQHETEHLDGVLFVDNARDLHTIEPKHRPNVTEENRNEQ
jgi:peptide deformylase